MRMKGDHEGNTASLIAYVFHKPLTVALYCLIGAILGIYGIDPQNLLFLLKKNPSDLSLLVVHVLKKPAVVAQKMFVSTLSTQLRFK